jgi:solute carrier family 45 protein 1/2/4
MLLVPNGEDIGRALGDYYPSLERPPNGTDTSSNRTEDGNSTLAPDANYPHPWSIFFTVLGTVLLDVDADACQSPSRAYLLDVTVPGMRNTASFDKLNPLHTKVYRYPLTDSHNINLRVFLS